MKNFNQNNSCPSPSGTNHKRIIHLWRIVYSPFSVEEGVSVYKFFLLISYFCIDLWLVAIVLQTCLCKQGFISFRRSKNKFIHLHSFTAFWNLSANSIAPPFGKSILKLALPSHPPMRYREDIFMWKKHMTSLFLT